MAFPSKPPEAENGWIQRKISTFWKWCNSRQPLPDPNDFDVSERPEGVAFSLKSEAVRQIVSSTAFRLQIIDASAHHDAIVRIRLGKIAGRIADAGMSDPDDDPVFTITLTAAANTYVIYCKVTMAYDTTFGYWSSTDCDIDFGASLPTDDATNAYVEIGSAIVISDGDGGFKVSSIPPQSAKGDQWVVRSGGDDDTTHINGTQGA